MRAVRELAVIAALVGGAVYWEYGTISPCGVLRETVRQRDGLAAVLPDSIVDLALAGQYGELSPGRCLAILTNLSTTVPNGAQASRPQSQVSQPSSQTQVTPRPNTQTAPVTAQDSLQWAAQVSVQATNECRVKRLSGELPTHVASAQCSNPTMVAAFKEAHYRYMDLIQLFAAKRLELATKIDRGELTEQQAQLESNKVYAGIQATERQRDNSGR